MTYSLEFHDKALKEWHDLDEPVRARLKSKLAERLETPHISAARLRGAQHRYKIKLMRPGVRLVYEVIDRRLIVCVLAVGKRESSVVYRKAGRRRAT